MIFWGVADPFADAIKGSEEGVQDGFVHIRIQQRNGRKTLTTVQGLSSEYDLKKIVRACKKVSNFIDIKENVAHWTLFDMFGGFIGIRVQRDRRGTLRIRGSPPASRRSEGEHLSMVDEDQSR